MPADRSAHIPDAAARAALPDTTPAIAQAGGASLDFVGHGNSAAHAQLATNQLNLLKTYCLHASGRTHSAAVGLNDFLLPALGVRPLQPNLLRDTAHRRVLVFRGGIYNASVPA